MNPDRPTRTTRVLFGASEAGQRGVDLFLRLHLLVLGTELFALPALASGLAVAVGIAWDAVTDPVMGWLSDRTRHPAGPRRPWMVRGALLTAVALVGLVLIPATWSPVLAWTALAVLAALVSTGTTLVSVPAQALAADLHPSSRIRGHLFASRMGWGNLGLIAAVLLPAAVLAGGGDRAGYLVTATGLAGLVLLTTGITVAVTRARPLPTEAPPPPAFSHLVAPLGCAPFRRLLLAGTVALAALGINGALALPFYRQVLALEETAIGVVLMVFIVVWSASLPLWLWLGRRFGPSRAAALGCLLLGLLISVIYPLAPAGDLVLPLIAAVLGGLCAGSAVLLELLVAICIDRSGPGGLARPQAGVFFGLWNLATKASRALAVLLAGLALEFADLFDGRFLAWAFGPGVGLWFLAGAALLLRFPLPRPRPSQPSLGFGPSIAA